MKDLVKKDLRYNWHPYTQMKDCERTAPVLIDSSKGMKLYDAKGNFYYDTISSWWCNVHGHNHPKIKKAIKKQIDLLDHVLFAGFTHAPAVLLAEKLVSIAPEGLRKVFYSDNGSTAVETALKMSFQYWQNTGKLEKTKFIALDHGYHGDTIGAMSVSGVGLFNSVFTPLFFKSFKARSPYCYRCPAGKSASRCDIDCLSSLEKILSRESNRTAAFILEPLVMAAGGMIIYPKVYLERAAMLTGKYGVHLILDEVATGFGRTGKMFACEYANVKPDFICLSKGITSGSLPLGVTMTTERIYNAFYADYNKKKTFYHGHTYAANPIACSAALASLEIFEEEGTLNRLKEFVPLFHKGLERFRSLSIVGDVRYIGMIGAMELVKDRKKKEPFSFRDRVGLEVYGRGLKRHLILRPLGNIIYLFLPLCARPHELDYILNAAYDILKSLSK